MGLTLPSTAALSSHPLAPHGQGVDVKEHQSDPPYPCEIKFIHPSKVLLSRYYWHPSHTNYVADAVMEDIIISL